MILGNVCSCCCMVIFVIRNGLDLQCFIATSSQFYCFVMHCRIQVTLLLFPLQYTFLVVPSVVCVLWTECDSKVGRGREIRIFKFWKTTASTTVFLDPDLQTALCIPLREERGGNLCEIFTAVIFSQFLRLLNYQQLMRKQFFSFCHKYSVRYCLVGISCGMYGSYICI